MLLSIKRNGKSQYWIQFSAVLSDVRGVQRCPRLHHCTCTFSVYPMIIWLTDTQISHYSPLLQNTSTQRTCSRARRCLEGHDIVKNCRFTLFIISSGGKPFVWGCFAFSRVRFSRDLLGTTSLSLFCLFSLFSILLVLFVYLFVYLRCDIYYPQKSHSYKSRTLNCCDVICSCIPDCLAYG